MENVLKKDTETLPDVIAEGDPESNINIFESCFFHLTLHKICLGRRKSISATNSTYNAFENINLAV